MSDNNRIAISQVIQTAKENFLLHTELFAVVAAERKAKYDALCAAGFTKEEAMRIICAEVGGKG